MEEFFLPRPIPHLFDNRGSPSNNPQKMPDPSSSSPGIDLNQPPADHPTSTLPGVSSAPRPTDTNHPAAAPRGPSNVHPHPAVETSQAPLLFRTLLKRKPGFTLQSLTAYARKKPEELFVALQAMALGDEEDQQMVADLLEHLYRVDEDATLDIFARFNHSTIQ